MLELDLQFSRRGFRLEAGAELDQRVVGLFGRSGAGKSTLLHLLAGLAAPARGRIALDGTTWFDSERRINVPAHRRRAGVVFQDGRLFPHLSVRGNLRYGQRLAPRRERRFGFEHIVSMLELGPLLRRRPQHLSGGERQRVALGRALLSSPHMLLMDEPLAGLDQKLKSQILPFLQRIRDATRIPILYVSHDLGELLQLTDHLLVLEAGRVLGAGRYLDLVQQRVIHDHDAPGGLLNVLDAVVAEHQPSAGCTRLEIPGMEDLNERSDASLMAPLCDYPVGTAVSAGVLAQDVSLATAPVDAISIRNQAPGRITRTTRDAGQVLAEIDVGIPLLAEISYDSMNRLQIRPGRRVWCLMKSNALKILGLRESSGEPHQQEPSDGQPHTVPRTRESIRDLTA